MNKHQKEELQKFIDEITEEAKSVVEDYVNNPTEMSGSVTQVHENSPYLATKEERLLDTTGKRVKINKKDAD